LARDEDVFVDAGPRIPWAQDDVGEALAVAFHKPLPIHPGRTKVANASNNMKQRVEGGAADIHPGWVMTVV
jgi:hypothetical protein